MVFSHQIIGQIIIGVHNKQIAGWPVAPLKARIQINVVTLLVVLHKCGKENFVGKRDV